MSDAAMIYPLVLGIIWLVGLLAVARISRFRLRKSREGVGTSTAVEAAKLELEPTLHAGDLTVANAPIPTGTLTTYERSSFRGGDILPRSSIIVAGMSKRTSSGERRKPQKKSKTAS